MGEVKHGVTPTIQALAAQLSFAGANLLYKFAAKEGMNFRVLTAYRFVLATLFTVPLAFFMERNKRPKLTWIVLFQGFLCGLFGGAMAQNMYVQALAYTSATFAAAFTNLIPVMTFLLALAFRLEDLGWSKVTGKAKVLGTLMGVGGAMLMTFYKGPEITIWNTHIDLLNKDHYHDGHVAVTHPNTALGALLALGTCVSYALWLIVQAKMAERYPCPYSMTALMSVTGLFQTVIFALFTTKEWSQWNLQWNFGLFITAYTGIFASGLMFTLVALSVRSRGPLFVAIFSPLTLVIVAIAGSLILGEKLHVGSVIGSVLIVIGLYIVLWGRGQEVKKKILPSNSERSLEESKNIEIVLNLSSAENKKNFSDPHNKINGVSANQPAMTNTRENS